MLSPPPWGRVHIPCSRLPSALFLGDVCAPGLPSGCSAKAKLCCPTLASEQTWGAGGQQSGLARGVGTGQWSADTSGSCWQSRWAPGTLWGIEDHRWGSPGPTPRSAPGSLGSPSCRAAPTTPCPPAGPTDEPAHTQWRGACSLYSQAPEHGRSVDRDSGGPWGPDAAA